MWFIHRSTKVDSLRTHTHKMCLMNTYGLRAALLLATAALALTACSGESEAESPAPTREDIAREVGQPECEQEASEQLKSPGSAVYEWENAVTKGDYGDDLKMRATVDSQNGFGAVLRSHVVCHVWVSGDLVTNVEATVTKNPKR